MPVTSSSEVTRGQVAEQHERLVERGVHVVGAVPAAVHRRVGAEHVVVGQHVGEPEFLDPPARRRGPRRRHRRARSAGTPHRHPRPAAYRDQKERTASCAGGPFLQREVPESEVLPRVRPAPAARARWPGAAGGGPASGAATSWRRPNRCIRAGTSTVRRTNASSATAAASPMPNSAMSTLAHEHEREEDGDHDRRGGGDDAGGVGLADAHGRALSPVRDPFLVHPADQEHLVVHGQAEQDRAEHHRQERLDRAGRAEAERPGPPAPLEERGHHAERRRRRRAGSSPRPSAGMSRLRKASTSSRKLKPDDRGRNQRQLGVDHRGEVVERGGLAADVDPQRGARSAAGMTWPRSVVIRVVVAWASGDVRGDHLDAPVVPCRRRGRPGARWRTSASRAAGALPARRARRVGRRTGLRDQQQRAVEARPEALGEQVVGLPGGGLTAGSLALVGGAEPQAQHGEGEHDHDRDGHRRPAPPGAAARCRAHRAHTPAAALRRVARRAASPACGAAAARAPAGRARRTARAAA